MSRPITGPAASLEVPPRRAFASGPGEGGAAPAGEDGRPSAPGSSELQELGRRIRKIRIERRMTLKDVEKLSGLSATHLSEIERGRTSPTIGALIRVARSLEREPSYFIETEERSDVAHVHADEIETRDLAPGVTARSLTPGIPGSEICAYRVRLAGAAEWRLKAQAIAGEALVLVLCGTLELATGEDPVAIALGAGDAVRTPLSRPTRMRPVGAPVELIAVLNHPLEDPA